MMDEFGAGPSLSSTYPDPPSDYLNLYSDENVAKGKALSPPAPVEGNYYMFGRPYNTNESLLQSLEDQGVRRVYPVDGFDHKAEMKKLNHSILANFLDLLELLIRCPNALERHQKLDDIELLFINLHHLINEYRPHQARETLRLMLDVQYKDRCRIVDRFQRFYEIVANQLKACMAEIPAHRQLPLEMEERLNKLKKGESLTGLGRIVDDRGDTVQSLKDQIMVTELTATGMEESCGDILEANIGSKDELLCEIIDTRLEKEDSEEDMDAS